MCQDTDKPFQCAQCGACCYSGHDAEPGVVTLLSVVFFYDDDVERASKYLGMSEHDFRSKYGVLKPGYIDVTGGKCPLLENKKCIVHAEKPKYCAQKNPCEEKCQKLKKM